jgi:ribosomal-protein-alanine N-acetyltransferase
MTSTLVEPPLKLRELETHRLVLQPIGEADVDFLQRCSSDPRVALGMGMLVPYPEGKALEYVMKKLPRAVEEGEGFGYIVRLRETGERIGAIGAKMLLYHSRAALWYWFDVPFWGRGYCTEAASRLIEHLFRDWGLNRVEAVHHVSNPASGSVMRKLGMKPEALLRRYSHRGGAYVDSWIYATFHDEWVPAGAGQQ